jgi:hypothetical protein
MTPPAHPIHRARRLHPIRRRFDDFNPTPCRVPFPHRAGPDANGFIWKDPRDEHRQRPIMGQPLAALDQLLDPDEEGFV